MAEEKDTTSSAADDAYSDIQRQRSEAAKSAPTDLDDIFDSNTDDNDQQSNPDYDWPEDEEKPNGATAEEQEEAEAENAARNKEMEEGDYDDGLGEDTDGYKPDQSEETKARENERENLRDNDIDDGDEVANEPDKKKGDKSKKDEEEDEKLNGPNKSSAQTTASDTAGNELTDEALDIAAEATESAAIDEAANVVVPGAGLALGAADAASHKIFHQSLWKLVGQLLILIPVGMLALVAALAMGLNPSSNSSSTPSIPPTTATGSNIADIALTQLAKPYVWAGLCINPGPPAGCANYDCSGLVTWAVYWGTGGAITLPHSSKEQCGNSGEPFNGTKIMSTDDLQAGDLVCFGDPIHHVGISIGGGQYVHAPHTGDVVKISDLTGRSDLRWGVRITP